MSAELLGTATGASGVPVRPAATVMLLRDGPDGLEVLMQQRTHRMVFVAGAHVFPGGRVDEGDRLDELHLLSPLLADGDATARLDVGEGGLAWWVAGIRECFEEAGVLLARHLDGRPFRLDDPSVAARFHDHRLDVHAGRRRFGEVLAAEGLEMATDQLAYVARWVTPDSPTGLRRFDARFFVAVHPDGQEAFHDDVEAIASTWVRPTDALAAGERGEWLLILPTKENLRRLLPYDRAVEAWDDLRVQPVQQGWG